MCIVPFFSFIGDGSTDVSTKQEEAIGVRYTWKVKQGTSLSDYSS